MWKHRLSNHNKINKTADCAECGPGVRIVGRGRNGKFRCARMGVPAEACEVCGSTNKICYDHDHATGKHRGWLCDRCNRILGAAKDDPELLIKLADYLSK